MPLHPQAQKLLEFMSGLEEPYGPDTDPAVARARLETLAQTVPESMRDPVHRVEDRLIPGPRGDVPVRVYRPSDETGLPILVFFHGGGFVTGSVNVHDGILRPVVTAADCVIVSVDYGLAPEVPFPGGVEDCWAATQWVAEHAADLGGDPGRIAVGGDSAGGNLAAVVALEAKEAGGPDLVFQLLLYPVTTHDPDSPSIKENSKGYFLEESDMVWFSDKYFGSEEAALALREARNWRAFPLLAPDVTGLPPAFVITAEFDPLRDQGEDYARLLQDAGVPTTLKRYDGMFHGFFGMQRVLDTSKELFDDVVAALRAAFGTG
ncbi:MAG: putative lipase [Actinomycetia bacterium]|nr:putative lipase [Actinomycetes bacterium]